MHFQLYLAFAASAWAALTCADPCASDQATAWSLLTPGMKAPSWPFECLHVYELPDNTTLENLSADQDVSAEDLLTWNCFYRCQGGELEQGTEICIDAILEEPPQNPHYPLPEISKVLGSTLSRTVVTLSPLPASSGRIHSIPGLSVAASRQTLGSNLLQQSFRLHNRLDGAEPASSNENNDWDIVSTGLSSTWSTTTALMTSSESATGTLSQPSSSATYTRFTEACNVLSDKAEDCRATTECDASLMEYPVCSRDKCVCRTVPCSTSYDCDGEQVCRDDDHDAFCNLDQNIVPDVKGLCECKPKITGCGNKQDPQLFCSEQLDCTLSGHIFSPWKEFGQCTKGHPEGQCRCQTVLCPYDPEDTQDDEFCKTRISCPDDTAVACKVRYLSSSGPRGYCTCAKNEFISGNQQV